MRVVTTVGAVALLVSPAYFCGLILYRFVRDDTHPLYRLALVLRDEPKRQIFIKNSWGWNLPLLDLLPPARFTVRFVPSLETACSEVRDGDLVVDLVFSPLTGQCSGVEQSPVFHASNLGPSGYPFPADHLSPYSGTGADTVDYHYLFEDVTLSRLTR
jgi:hypothetical protein